MTKKNKQRIFSFEIDAKELSQILDQNIGEIKIELIITHANIKVNATTKLGPRLKIKNLCLSAP